jgi:hypothetical protein
MSTRFAAALVAACVLVGSGCLAVNEGTHRAKSVPSGKYYQTGIYWNNFVLTDDAISRKIAVEDQGSRRTATGTLQVWATLRNRTNFRLQVEVRVQFFDADKQPLEGPTAWQRLALPANTIASWQENSIGTTQVAYYFGEIREGR